MSSRDWQSRQTGDWAQIGRQGYWVNPYSKLYFLLVKLLGDKPFMDEYGNTRPGDYITRVLGHTDWMK